MQVRRTLALALVPLLLTGCGLLGGPSSEPTPIFPDPTTPTRTPSPSPTVDPLAIPDAMRDKSLDGAEAAVQHYFDMYNHLIETGDAKPIKKLYGDGCSICSAYVGIAEQAYQRGNSIDGSQTLVRARAYSGAEGFAFVIGKYDSTPLFEVSKSGKRSQRTPGGGGKLIYTLAFEKRMWRLVRIEVPQ